MKHLAQQRSILRHLWWLITLLVLLLAVYVVAARELMQLVPRWRAPLVQVLQQQSGLPFSIGALSGKMQGLTPVFHLDNLTIPAADGNPAHALTIKQATISLDVIMSLLHGSVFLRNLHLTGMSLHLTQRADGSFHLQGFPQTSHKGKAGLHDLLQLLYQQKQVILEDVDVTLQLQDMPVIKTDHARLEMRSSGHHHRLALRFHTLEHPLSMDARVTLSEDAYRLQDLAGKAYLAISGKDLQYWIPDNRQPAIRLADLDGKLRFWMTLEEGSVQQARLAMQLQHLELTNNHSHWQATGVNGLFALRQHQGYQLQVQKLDFDTSNGHWHSGISSAWWNGKRGDKVRWKLRLSELDLKQLSRQLAQWPFPLPKKLTGLQKHLSAMRPQAEDVSFFVAGKRHEVTRFSGKFKQAIVHADNKMPGVAGLSGWFDGTPDSGVAIISSEQLKLDIPRLYSNTLAASVNGSVRWFRKGNGQLYVETGAIRVDNKDATGKMLVGVTIRPNDVPLLHLLAKISGDNARHAKRYFPDRKLHKNLVDWLDQAFGAGQLTSGHMLYEGPVRINPKRQQDRTQQIQLNVSGATLHFMPGWPPLRQVTGSVLVAGRKVYGHHLSGEIYASHFDHGAFDVWDDAPGGSPKLMVAARVKGKAADVTRLFDETPLADYLPSKLLNWKANEGQVNGSLLLRLGLKHDAGVEKKVIVQANAKALSLKNTKRHLVFDKVAGKVHFDLQKGVEVQHLRGDWLGVPVSGEVHTDNNQVTVKASGRLTVSALQKWLDTDWLKVASGASRAQMTLALPWKSSRPVILRVTSPLQGVAVNLPAPLGKEAASKRHLSATLTAGKQLDFHYQSAPPVSAYLSLAEGKLQGGLIRVGHVPVGNPGKKGLVIKGHLPELKVAPWRAWLVAKNTGAGQAGKSDDLPVSTLSLSVDSLTLLKGLKVENASLNIKPNQAKGWAFDLDSHVLKARMTLPHGYRVRGSQPLTLTVSHLTLPASKTSGGSNSRKGQKNNLLADISPMDMPIANVSLQQVKVGKVGYGSWQGQLRPDKHGIKVADLTGHWRHANFSGELQWLAQDGRQGSHFKGKIKTDDLEALQKAWGMTPLVISDKASSNVNLSWKGSPLDIDLLGLHGSANIKVGSCRLPHLDNNNPLMRLMGVLNIGSIARRLKFDFSDLYRKGLSCDSIKGRFRFNKTDLTVNSLHLKSPSADIRLTGHTNLKTRTLDDEMTVVLPLSSNLYAGCLAGPAACAGIFVFDKLFGHKMEKAAALHYRVGGTWEKPVVKEK